MSDFKPYPIDTLDDCAKHYVEPNKNFITCSAFGHCDGMDGSCWYCMEFTPLQWYMCRDETEVLHWARNGKSREEAIREIEERLQTFPERPHAVSEYLMYLKYRSEYGKLKSKLKYYKAKIIYTFDKFARKFKKPREKSISEYSWDDMGHGNEWQG